MRGRGGRGDSRGFGGIQQDLEGDLGGFRRNRRGERRRGAARGVMSIHKHSRAFKGILQAFQSILFYVFYLCF